MFPHDIDHQILLTDGPAPVPATFSDDSFESVANPYAPVVVARLPSGLDLRWHSDVVDRLARASREIKASRLLKYWADLPRDLRAAITRTIREATISIVDARAYQLEFDDMLVRVIRGAGEEILSRIRGQFLAAYVADRTLWNSPAWRIQRMLYGDDPLTLEVNQIYGISSANEYDDSLFQSLRTQLQKQHNIRLFGARSAAAFVELADPEERVRAIEQLWDRRYFMPFDVDLTILARTDSTHHVFDEGNRPSVEAIGTLRTAARKAVRRRERWSITLPRSGGQSEESSRTRRELQAADIAAGYARRLYESDEGLKKVCLEFRRVLLNGTVVRDWKQSAASMT